MELINKDLKKYEITGWREKLRTHPKGSRLFGRHIIDRFEGQMALPSCMYVCMY
jgi:hypothetical protein